MSLSNLSESFYFFLFCSFIRILHVALTHARTHTHTHAHTRTHTRTHTQTHTHTHNTGMHNAPILFFSPSPGVCFFCFPTFGRSVVIWLSFVFFQGDLKRVSITRENRNMEISEEYHSSMMAVHPDTVHRTLVCACKSRGTTGLVCGRTWMKG